MLLADVIYSDIAKTSTLLIEREFACLGCCVHFKRPIGNDASFIMPRWIWRGMDHSVQLQL